MPKMPWKPQNIASRELTEKLRRIVPSHDDYGELRPCRAVTKTGEVIERLLMVEEGHGLPGEVDIQQIADVSEYPRRLPPRFSTQLYTAGESGMGYIVYTIDLRSGASLVVVSGNLAIDFPDLPDAIEPADIIAVRPHVGRERTFVGEYIETAPFKICCYVPSTQP